MSQKLFDLYGGLDANIQFVENVYAISGSILRPFKGLFKITSD